MNIPSEVILDETVSANTESKFFDLSKSNSFSLQIVAVGTLSGTLSIKGANEQVDAYMTELPSGSIALSGASAVALYARAAEFDCAKVFYTHTSGTGTIRIVAKAKA